MTAQEITLEGRGSAPLIGRAAQYAEARNRALAGLPTLVVAPAGRGKSVLLATVAESWHSRGLPVLSLTAGPEDRIVRFGVLAEMFTDMSVLEGPQREAARWIRRECDGPAPELAAVRMAALSCATVLSRQGRLLIAADDVQWWDPASADVLAFLARRGGDRLAVLAGSRPDGPPAAALLGREAVEVPVPPLSAAETAVLSDGCGIPHRLAGRVHAAAGGNPRLAVDIMRGLDTPDPVSLVSPAAARTIRGWLSELPEQVWQVLLIAAVAADPAVATVRRAAGTAAAGDALAAAERAGLIALDGHGMLAFPAAAVRETLVADASERTLRTAHALLAEASVSPADRLWHAASAREGADAGVAAALAEAATAARERGERGRAAELALLAAEMTPVGAGFAGRAAKAPPPAGGSAVAVAIAAARACGMRRGLDDGEEVVGAGGAAWAPAGASAAARLGWTTWANVAEERASRSDRADHSASGSTGSGTEPQPAQAVPGASTCPDMAGYPSGRGAAAAPSTPSMPRRPLPAGATAPAAAPAAPCPEALLLAAAIDAGAANRLDLARTALARLDASGADPAARARARIAVVDAVGQALAGLDALLAHALADADAAGDPALQSAVHLRLSWHAHLALGRNDRARRAAAAAVRSAQLSKNPEALSAALTMMARIQQVTGLAEATGTLRRALALEAAPEAGCMVNSPRWTAMRFAVFDDRLDEARHHLRALAPGAERSGSIEDLRMVLRAAVEIEARAGNGARARQLAERLLTLPGTETASPGPAWHAAAQAELAGGALDQALRYAELGAESSEQEHDQIFLIRSLHISGMVRLLQRDVNGAADDLRRVRELERRQGVKDPATVPYHADLAEALVALGELDAAEEVAAEARDAAARLRRRSVLAALDRAEAVRRTAAGEADRAEALFLRAERSFGDLGLPLERGRVLLARSVMEKRRRRAGQSRITYQNAVEIFAGCGAPLWDHDPDPADRSTPKRDRGPVRDRQPAGGPALRPVLDGLDAEPGSAGTGDRSARSDASTRPGTRTARTTRPAKQTAHAALTPAEQRVVQLVAAGCANREVAATLFLSVKTVESVLTGVYRKLGVRSRTQLCLLLSND